MTYRAHCGVHPVYGCNVSMLDLVIPTMMIAQKTKEVR